MRWLVVLGLFVASCGDASHVGECGNDGEECCYYPDGTVGCHNDPTQFLPSQSSLGCKGYPNGARYCVHCGYDGEVCCPYVSGCVQGLVCSPNGDVCQRH